MMTQRQVRQVVHHIRNEARLFAFETRAHRKAKIIEESSPGLFRATYLGHEVTVEQADPCQSYTDNQTVLLNPVGIDGLQIGYPSAFG